MSAGPLSIAERVGEALRAGGVEVGSPLLVGFSGGVDSVALVEALLEGGWRSLTLGHVDHGLRAESGEDAEWARRWAAERGLAFCMERVAVREVAALKGIGLEEAGREARYAFFSRCVVRTGVGRVVLAHQADDQVETFLFRLMRGAGLRGLAGMREVSWREEGRWVVLRPMLGIWRVEIEAYLRERGVAFRTDASNADRVWTRNRIRHELIPELERVMGRPVREVLWRGVEQLRAEADWAEEREMEVLGGGTGGGELGEALEVTVLRGWPLALQRRVVCRWLRRLGLEEVGFEEVERVLGLVRWVRPAKVNLPRGWFARRRKGRIFLDRGEGWRKV